MDNNNKNIKSFPAGNSLMLVDGRVLPDIFTKVLETKRLLASKDASSTTEATKITGISRSAFYKYRDAVFPYTANKTKQLLTVQTLLKDTPGILSCMLLKFAECNANILTVYQNIPIDHIALVSISARVENLTLPLEAFVSSLSTIKGVLKVDIVVSDS